jgi:hypothetical protein
MGNIALIMIRIYALYDCDRRVLALFIVLVLVAFIVALVSLTDFYCYSIVMVGAIIQWSILTGKKDGEAMDDIQPMPVGCPASLSHSA